MSKTITELLYLIEKKGLGSKEDLSNRVLTAAYLKRAPVEVYEYLMLTRPTDVESALNEPTETEKREADATRFFGKATAEESQAVLEVASEFCSKHKDFAQTDHNALQVIEWLREHRRVRPALKDFEAAYRDLKFNNALEIHEPEPTLSADQFLAEHPELRDQRKSPWGEKKISTSVETFLSQYPEFKGDAASAEALISAVRESGEVVSTHLLSRLFHQLVQQNKITKDTRAVAQAGVTRMVDYR